ncbi:MAG: DUF3108 domain-containing protein [Desulfovibrionales bacterium]|nr:MAG: DUF3108 domain-containing protein [Desulfovibrionales bacterium]
MKIRSLGFPQHSRIRPSIRLRGKTVSVLLFLGLLALSPIMLAFGNGVWTQNTTPDRPWPPGEVLNYQVRWGVVPAARATLEVHAVVDIDGQPARHFVMTAQTNAFADLFYRYRNHIDAFTDLDMTGTLLFQKREVERKRHRSMDVRFDWDTLETQVMENGAPGEGVQFQPGTFDPLSIFYVFRSMPLEVGSELLVPVSDGKKLVDGIARVRKREVISVDGREFDCFLVEPDLRDLGGVFRKSPDAVLQIWVTADTLRIPVRIRSQVAVGAFTAELDLEPH